LPCIASIAWAYSAAWVQSAVRAGDINSSTVEIDFFSPLPDPSLSLDAYSG